MINWFGPASCTKEITGCLCEQSSGVLAQPSNAISAIAFLVVAFVLLVQYKKERWVWGYALALVGVGIGTAYYHATMTFLGQTIDFGGMNFVILLGLFYYLARATRAEKRPLVWLGYWASVALSAASLVWAPVLRRPLFAVMIAAVLYCYLVDPKRLTVPETRRKLIRGLAVFLFGFVLWNLDNLSAFCWPNNPVQLHAIWHVCGAIASYYLFAAAVSVRKR